MLGIAAGVPARVAPGAVRGALLPDIEGPPAYDITPDGQRFVMVQEHEEAAPETRQIVYIPDFFDELKAKMAEAGQ